jgi:transposase/very-short-patch-repair endonuclease
MFTFVVYEIGGSRMPLYRNKDWLHEHYIVRKMTSQEIAELVGVNSGTVCRWLRKLNIPVRNISSCQQPRKKLNLLQSKDWLQKEYIDGKKSIKEIARNLNVSDSTVSQWLDKHNIPRKSYSELIEEDNPKSSLLKNKDWLREKYITEFTSIKQLSDCLEVSQKLVAKWLDIHGIKKRNIQESKMGENKFNDLINDGKTIPKLYRQGLNIEEIGEHFDCSCQTVYRRLLDSNVKIRGFTERAKERNPLLGRLRDKKWLYHQYVTRNYSIIDIAEHLESNATTVYFWLQKHGIEIKDSSFSHSKERYSDEDLEKMLKNLAERLGHIPSVRELNEYCSQGLCPSAATYSLRGGLPYWQKRVFGKRNRAWLEWQKKCISVFNKVLGYPKFRAEKSFDWLRSPITGHRLKVDAYYPKLKLCIEFDGIGHFKPVKFLKGQNADKQFRKTQIHDAEKNKRIPEHGLTLIRFRHDEPLTEEYVKELLEEFLEQVA